MCIWLRSKCQACCVTFYLHSFFPRDPKVAPGQEASDRVSGQMVYPALFSQLSHDRVDPRKSGLALERRMKFSSSREAHIRYRVYRKYVQSRISRGNLRESPVREHRPEEIPDSINRYRICIFGADSNLSSNFFFFIRKDKPRRKKNLRALLPSSDVTRYLMRKLWKIAT